MIKYEPVIGLEVHAQLKTASKMYCSCNSDYQNAAPNTRVCPVCLGLPGALPVINREAIKSIIMIGLALNCSISEYSKFDRKNYTYPDLMKGYQVSQYDLPVCLDGYMDLSSEGTSKRIGIERVHMEEDVAKLSHHLDSVSGQGYSLVDVNRSGVPLVEMVSRPDIRSAEEARQYLINYQTILRYLGVSTANMDEGSFRCDANVSIRPEGQKEFGTKVEIKNMNSFRSVFRAIEYELERQSDVLSSGGRVTQETRGWLEDKGVTISLRSKEEANDYRYFPEPDLPPLNISKNWISEIASSLPELPSPKKTRFMKQYELSEYDSSLLTNSYRIADYFEKSVSIASEEFELGKNSAKSIANWTITELTKLSNEYSTEIYDSKVTPKHLAELISLIEKNVIGTPQGKTVLAEVFVSGDAPTRVVEKLGLAQISNSSELDSIVITVISENPNAVADYKSGKETAAKFLVGQVMKATQGKANPSVVSGIIVEHLKSM
ncbi:MAG: Asp-tRNA(Asn)/Glu-tRNA(Gln) amidotransferase GatCAB subunit B [Chloroflexi bacterium]|nr:Asp-tRNA(Asn)/Glu-tRNA(Gln) amidotransferase GatCAB subunit B [Chloroflexota bacterium]MBL75684.1 Asp-tRNA(Asn)/Glu-tRNA(Gln) amidotransferase GatCAB subunit B [Chloroflexota bacterium]|tara:strand:- start:19832 stop:21307 length:1476 start_codon:yes stop_codon:yes gene_type:complete